MAKEIDELTRYVDRNGLDADPGEHWVGRRFVALDDVHAALVALKERHRKELVEARKNAFLEAEKMAVASGAKQVELAYKVNEKDHDRGCASRHIGRLQSAEDVERVLLAFADELKAEAGQ